MAGLDWLTARPVAHRGLHDAGHGVIENTASAFSAAIADNYAIECDLRLSADGEAMVFHDRALDRLTTASGEVIGKTAAELGQIAFKNTHDRMLTLPQLCELVAGRVPLILEMKGEFDGDRRLPARIADVLRTYSGPVAAMSFDPDQVAALTLMAPGLPRGIVAESRYGHPEWEALSGTDRFKLAHLLHAGRTRPHFVAYAVNDLPAISPLIARWLFGLPLLTWTVRTDAQRACAKRWADQMIFEGFRP
jgi:glycerophosphoryl diester phosphodiesterase